MVPFSFGGNAMGTPRKRVSRRDLLAGFGFGAGALALAGPVGTTPLAAQAKPPRALEEIVPMKGRAGPGLEAFDKAMLQIMDRHGVPGAALALAKEGRLVLAKGYGWANVPAAETVQPLTLFGLGSLSKPITAVATLKLIEDGKLGLDDPVFGLLKDLKPPRGARVDPNLRDVTVRQCLNHSCGWNRTVSGDPINWEPQICRALHLPQPLSSVQFLSFVMTLPLDFKPGTDAHYCNIGYVLLGEVIAKVSGQAYHRYVSDNVLKPMGITRPALHRTDGKYLEGEARRHLAGTIQTLPPMLLPMVDAAGGWSASAVDMVRFLTNLDGSRGKSVLSEKSRQLMVEPPPKPLKPRADGSWFGLGWDFVKVMDKTGASAPESKFRRRAEAAALRVAEPGRVEPKRVVGKTVSYSKDGSYDGIRAFMKRLPTGVNWALLYNASMNFDPIDAQIATKLIRDVHSQIERFDKYPDIDLFKDYP
jgi:CubicO group peptidase (beta-lactamase class C family)